MKSVFLINNSDCVRRRLDSARLEACFKANGFRIACKPQEADYNLFVTCSYTQSKRDECFSVINKLKKFKGELIVGGCLPEIFPESFREKFSGRYISTKTIGNIDNLFSDFSLKWDEIPDSNIPPEFIPPFYLESGVGNNYRYLKNEIKKKKNLLLNRIRNSFTNEVVSDNEAFLRVGYGCAGRCAYCAIHKAIGKIRSKTIEECVSEYRSLLGRGYRSFVIVSDDIGPYGVDIGTNLPTLLEALSRADNGIKVKWDIRQLAPKWVLKFKETLKKLIEDIKIDHFLISIQTGSESLLKSMNRSINMDALALTLKEFREINPKLVLKTEVIVGFPSETEEDHQKTIEYLIRVGFNQVQLFTYSDVPGTKADEMIEKVPQDVIKERINKAVQILERKGISCLSPSMEKTV
ncbi:MAG: radical SAM protein [Bacteroidales bacterium]|nr:radical SAM protein [Bacteroidales bacterium]MCF8405862.1 radical SAM protein [Bacteroidales bacterium]